MKTGYDLTLFTEKGFRAREFFPHEVIRVPKQYPDTLLKLALRGVRPERVAAGACYQVNLYATRIEDFPVRLFRDRTINWHHQQLGRDGLVAAAGLFVEGDQGYLTLLQSDLCQQIYRDPKLKRQCGSKLNNRFRYWYKMLLNAVLDFAQDLGLHAVYSPTAAHIVVTTPKRVVPDLFKQIYDFVTSSYVCARRPEGAAEYWRLELPANRNRIARLVTKPESGPQPTRIICLYHDIEQDVDTEVSKSECAAALAHILEIEQARGVRATYNVLGTIYREVAPSILAVGGHALGLHTYDHNIDDPAQLARARKVDLQVKGYRPARSIITPELSVYQLSYHNFEWLMSSARSLGLEEPALDRGVVRIPAHLDDYDLVKGESYEDWMQRLHRAVETRQFVSVGLHDCYSQYWIEHFDQLLEYLQNAGELWNCDDLTNRVYLANAR